ncbi:MULTISPECIES: GMC family oxidoreductase [unclassified Marinobacter]|uniref:GMC family oxidoreductase n=1 Tax=unclassified Marinobacter TaxID=83889 RepID=UPI001928EBFC|nr:MULTISPECIES: GMC family oxidoreductase [unclassified Marinobacter]MBL3826596.1 GMC family oxidoreductase [Marinobacter sp. MC3]MBL3895195.1 GMC family oxidoreductase [Marinobacter sp. MW3]
MAKFDLNDDSLVVIIGSGAGGGTLANELAQKGIRSVVLEAGKRFKMSDIENDEWKMFGKISWLDKRYVEGPARLAKDFPNLPAWIVKGVGGATMHWAGVAMRFQEHEFKMRTTNGTVPGANVLDWPITLQELEPYYEKAEKKMGVCGTEATGMPFHGKSSHYKVVAEGAKRIGAQCEQAHLAINTQPRDGRPACQVAGFCMQGCRIGAKWSTMYTEIPKAEATGNVDVRPESMVLRIEHDASGRVSGVLYADGNGNQHLQKARVVAVAGNSIESPRMLLNSASNMFPNGLANSSGQVGQNYMTHTTGGVYAEFEKPVHMYKSTVVPGIVTEYQNNDPSRGYLGGYELEILHLGLPFMSAFMNPGKSGWGRELAESLENYDHMAGFWICGEDMAVESNNITLHPTEKDQYGLPVPVVYKTDHINDTRMRNHAYARSKELFESVGALKVTDLPPYPASHNMGTNRMSEHARDGVVNRWGQSHDIDNLFVSDGSQFTSSGTENPTLTIVALAIRQADYIADQMSKRNI